MRRRLVRLGDPNDITTESVTPAQQAAWYNVIGQFEDKAGQFLSAMSDLNSIDPSTLPADLQATQASLIARGNTLQSTITSIQSALSDVKNALTGAWDAITGAWSSVAGSITTAGAPVEINPATGLSPYAGLMGLGLLPLIPIAIVAAAVAALAYFLNDYAQFSQKVALLKQGYTPAQVAQATASSGGITSTLGILVWVAAGVAALVFLPKLIQSYRSATR